jgi:hypothetical protein
MVVARAPNQRTALRKGLRELRQVLQALAT